MSEPAQEANGQTGELTVARNGPLAVLTNGDTLLTLKQLAENLKVRYDRLRGFVEDTRMQAALGAVDVPGVKGVRYPPSAQETLAALLNAQDEGLVTPKTALAFVERLQRLPKGQTGELPDEAKGPLGLLPKEAIGQTARFTREEVLAAITEGTRQALAADSLMTLKAAHEEFGVSYATLRSLPKKRDGRKWKIRRSDVLEWIARRD